MGQPSIGPAPVASSSSAPVAVSSSASVAAPVASSVGQPIPSQEPVQERPFKRARIQDIID